MSNLRSDLIRVAATMPKGSSARKALLNVLAAKGFATMEFPELRKAVAKKIRGAKAHSGGIDITVHVMLTRIGTGDKAKTTIGLYLPGEVPKKEIPVTSVDDMVAKIRKAL